MKENSPNARDPAVPVSTGFRCTPTPRFQRIGVTSWSARYTARGAVSLERLAEDAHGDLVYAFTKPWSDSTTGITLSPVELLEKLAAIVPLSRVHLVRYAGCLAPHSQLRGAIIPTPRQQGVEVPEASSAAPHWS